MTNRVRPLSRGQQLLLQRLLASHVVTDDEARELYSDVKNSRAEEEGGGMGDMGRNLEHCLGVINASLGPAFGLEVRTVALSEAVAPPPAGREIVERSESDGSGALGSSSSSLSRKKRRGDEGIGGSPDGGGAGGGCGRLIRYHAVVNKLSDDVAKRVANHGPTARNPHELELLKLILEKLVERHLDGIENDGDNEGGNGVAGCGAALRRMEAINLRTDLAGAHKGKVGVQDAERAVSAFVSEGWLITAMRPPTPVSPQPDPTPGGGEASPGGEGEGEGESPVDGISSTRPRRRTKKRSIDGLGVMDGNDEESEELGKGSSLMIGPRTYMELPEILTDLGLGRERMPQFILHGSR